MSWPKIACMPKYRGIPVGSLWSWAHKQRDLKDEYKAQLGIPYEALAPVCMNTDCQDYGKPHTWDCKTQIVKPKKLRNEKALSYTRNRNKTLDEKARAKGYKSYSEFSTAILKGEAEIPERKG